jgi:probable HAF family extracellular repeat protein
MYQGDPFMRMQAIARPSWRAALAIAALSLGAAAHAANGYTYTELPPAGGDSLTVRNFSTGTYSTLNGVVWQGDGVTILPPLPSSSAGVSTSAPLWASAINNAGVVAADGPVRQAGGPVASTNHPAVWVGGALTELKTLGGTTGVTAAINDFGVVAGSSFNASGVQRPTLWSTVPIDLGTLGGATGGARGINNLNQVVGYSQVAGGLAHATLWTGTAIVDLGTPAGGATSSAADINDHGVIVGQSRSPGDGGLRAVLWQADGNATLLDT